MSKTILDVCCGSRMFWFDRHNTNTVFMDNRTMETELCDARQLVIAPDVVADFRAIPFENETFRLVVFDPPHLLNAGDASWLAKKYGKLNHDTWHDDIRQGFSECIRVLKSNGVLVFKWNEDQIRIGEVVKLAPMKPLFGQRKGKTHWLVFMKQGGES